MNQRHRVALRLATTLLLSTTSMLGFGTATARADSSAGAGRTVEFYVGGGGGGSPMTLDSRDFGTSSGSFYDTINGTTTSVTVDNSLSASYRAFFGLRLMQYVGLEVGYAHLGTQTFTAEGFNIGGGSNTFTDKGEYSASMTYVAGLLTLPTGSDGSYVFLKGGTAKVRTELTETITVDTAFSTRESVTVTTHSAQRPIVGLGFAFASESNRRFRLELEHVGEIGQAYVFGRSPGRASVTVFSATYVVSF